MLLKFILFLRLLLISTISMTPLISAFFDFGYEVAKVLFFLAVTSLAAILGVDSSASFLGRPPYYQGVILYFYLFLFFWLVCQVRIPLEWWSKGFALSAVIVSFWALKDWTESGYSYCSSVLPLFCVEQ